jgi:hypothetical protein
MNSHDYDNWVKIKKTLESSNNTNNFFYKRSCEIVQTKKDPLLKDLRDDKKSS